ncbi:MAG: ABC transporter substrate-binding protein, partial [Streptosporangiaceae bacterium]
AIFVPRYSGSGHAGAAGPPGQRDLNVAVVPAADSAGFFVALQRGLFAARGLRVTFVPAISSETVINAQALSEPGHRVDISCGNYVSYIEAQENYDPGKRPSAVAGGVVAADLDIFAEGSVMQPGAQGLYVMPGSRVRTLAGLEGRTAGVNAPGNILYLLAASVLAEHGLSVTGVRFAYYPLPEMAAGLKAGTISAAVLPEPFASQAELSLGVVPLADLDQGATHRVPCPGMRRHPGMGRCPSARPRRLPRRIRAGPADRRREPGSGGTGHGGACAAAGPDRRAGSGDGAGLPPGRPGRRGGDPARRRRDAAVPRPPPVQHPADADRRLNLRAPPGAAGGRNGHA